MGKIIGKILKILYSGAPTNKIRIWALKSNGNKIGADIYLGQSLLVINDSSAKDVNLSIGNRVSIAPRVTVILVSGANKSKLSLVIPWKIGAVEFCDDCWTGTGAIIYPGITIGQGSIVTAGSVVTKDVAPFTIVGGAPAKLIRSIEPF